MPRRQIKPLAINVYGHHRRSKRRCDLYSKSSDAAHTSEYGNIIGAKLCPADGLKRSCHRIRNNRERGQRNPIWQFVRHGAKPVAGNHHMCGKAAIAVIAGHKLLAADGGASRLAGRALATRNHRGNDHGPPQPLDDTIPRRDHPTGDFVSEHQRKRMPRRYAIECIADVGVTDAASRHFYHDLIWPRPQRGKFLPFQTLTKGRQTISVGSVDHAGGSLVGLSNSRISCRRHKAS